MWGRVWNVRWRHFFPQNLKTSITRARFKCPAVLRHRLTRASPRGMMVTLVINHVISYFLFPNFVTWYPSSLWCVCKRACGWLNSLQCVTSCQRVGTVALRASNLLSQSTFYDELQDTHSECESWLSEEGSYEEMEPAGFTWGFWSTYWRATVTAVNRATTASLTIEWLIPFWRGDQMPIPVLYKVEGINNDVRRFCANQTKTSGKTQMIWKKIFDSRYLEKCIFRFWKASQTLL